MGARLRIVREALGLSSGDFARSVGIDPSSYSKIESGNKPLKMDMGFAIAEAYGVTMDYLYRGRLTDLPDRVAEHLRQTLKGQDE
ncbi:helix-turn-helix domain-containing protein [Seohaeicola zhoushanensis]